MVPGVAAARLADCRSTTERDRGICRKWYVSRDTGRALLPFKLRSDSERLMDEANLLDNIAFGQPPDLPFADLVHRGVALNGSHCPIHAKNFVWCDARRRGACDSERDARKDQPGALSERPEADVTGLLVRHLGTHSLEALGAAVLGSFLPQCVQRCLAASARRRRQCGQ